MLELRENCGGKEPPSGPEGGRGLFETILVRGGRPVFLERHLERLAAGLAFLKMDGLPATEDIRRAIAACMSEAATGDGAVKLLAAGHQLQVLPRAVTPAPPKVVVGISATVVRKSGSPLACFKTALRPQSDALMAEAVRTGVFDCLALNEKGYLTDGGRTNLFLVLDDGVFTPPVCDGPLPGITRGIVLESGLAEERSFTVEHLDRARGGFLTNALIGVVPIGEVKGGARPFPDDPLIQEIRARYRQAVRSRLQSP